MLARERRIDRRSMISEQVNTLRDLAKMQDAEYKERIINRAADTIESLSAKLDAANMERSADSSEWIPCKERLPEENQRVIACFVHGTVTELAFYDGKFHGMYSYNEKVITAWQPLPKKYEGD